MPAQLGRCLVELTHQVLPLANAQIVEVLAFAHLAELVTAKLPALFLQVFPELQQGVEVAGGVLKTGM